MTPIVSVLIPTYNRQSIVQRTVDLIRSNLRYEGDLEIIVGNDGSPVEITGAHVIDKPSGSLGANLNRLIRAAPSDYLFQMDDDHWLTEPLDLTPHVKKLESDDRSGWIRLMGVAGHNFKLSMDMTPFSHYLIVDWSSPELYITSNRPHLKRRDFHLSYGMYPEGLKLGETEEGFCHQVIVNALQDTDPLHVLVPLDVHTESAWLHVGESWQGKGL